MIYFDLFYLFISECLYVFTSLRLYVFTSLRLYVFTSLRLSLWEFKKILPNTLIYESILIKIYMNANIMNMQIFHLFKYDLKGHWRSQKVTFMFILTLTYILMDGFWSLFLHISTCFWIISTGFLRHTCVIFALFVNIFSVY